MDFFKSAKHFIGFIKQELSSHKTISRGNDTEENISEINSHASNLNTINIEGKDRTYPFLIPNTEMFRPQEIIEEQCYSLLEFRSHSGPMQILDIGANLGLFSIYMKTKDPDCSIYCFEPVGSTYKILKENLKTVDGIELFQYGLSDHDETLEINIHPTNTGQNSLKFNYSSKLPMETIEIKDAGREFDRLGVNHFDVLKVDTEGCEVEILRSLGHRLANFDYIMVEHHSEQDRRTIDKLLENYTLFDYSTAQIGLGTAKYISNYLLSDNLKT